MMRRRRKKRLSNNDGRVMSDEMSCRVENFLLNRVTTARLRHGRVIIELRRRLAEHIMMRRVACFENGHITRIY